MSNKITVTIQPGDEDGMVDVGVDVYDEFDPQDLSRSDLVALAIVEFIERLRNEFAPVSD